MKKTSKTIPVERKETGVTEVLVFKEITGNGDNGVVIQAWHFLEDQNEDPMQQYEFIQMTEDLISDFITDYSSVSAQNFVDRYTF